MRKPWILAPVLALASLAACEGGFAYYAPAAPPPVRVETFGVAPGPGYIWVNGYWGYSGGRYVWNAGRWARPPRGHTRWEEGHWEHRGNRYQYQRGHWR